jgi:hypothetical protein
MLHLRESVNVREPSVSRKQKMKPFTCVLLLAASVCSAQTFSPTSSQKLTLQISNQEVRAEGHWIAVADEGSHLVGPAASEISCVKSERVCTEHKANFAELAHGQFSLSADTNIYEMERWTDTELVASQVRGSCRIRRTLKIDLSAQRVYAMDSLSEPFVNSRDCESWRGNHLYELRDGTSFSLKCRTKKK